MDMRRLVGAFSAIAICALGLATEASGASCPKGARTLKSSDLIKVYAMPGGAVKACWRPTGRSVTLDDGSLKLTVGDIRDRRVLYTVDDVEDDRSGGPYLFVRIMDVRRRRLTVDAVAWQLQSSTQGTGQMRDFLFAGRGVAWLAMNRRFPEKPWQVYYAPAGATGTVQPTLLGSAVSIEVGSLAAGRKFVYWTEGTTPARAALP